MMPIDLTLASYEARAKADRRRRETHAPDVE
jgi:hypothetical protein